MTSSQHGFTLLELLVSMVLLAFLTTMLLGGLNLGTRHLQHQSDRLDRSSRIALAQNFMRAQLADARTIADTAVPGQAIIFDGRLDGIDFIGPAPESVANGGLGTLAIDFAEGHDGAPGDLLVGWRPYPADRAASAHRSVLLDQVRQASFAYYGAAAPGEAPSWHSAWHGRNYLPSLVRLRLAFADGAAMPELVVALRLATGPAGPNRGVNP